MSTQEQTVQTRTWQGLQIPPAGTYDIDPSHTTVEIIARHMMVAKVRGRFDEFSGTIEIGEDFEQSRAEVNIEAASIDTREAQRDEHLRSADFLNVEQWPHITFTASNPRLVDDDEFVVDAELTVRETTKNVEVEVELDGVAKDPWGNTRLFLSGEFEIDREQFGITWNQVLETGGVLVGRKLKAELGVQAVLQTDES